MTTIFADECAPQAHDKICALRDRAAYLRRRADRLVGPVAEAVHRQAARLELQAYVLQQRFLVPLAPLPDGTIHGRRAA